MTPKKNWKRIGFDLDDTIIDHGPNRAKLLAGLPHPDLWSPEELEQFQNTLYGEISLQAEAMEHAHNVIAAIQKTGTQPYIVSRRGGSRRAFALEWLEKNLSLIERDNIHFVDTDQEKRDVVEKLGIEMFLDDKTRVLEHLPDNIKKVLYTKGKNTKTSTFDTVSDWQEFYRFYLDAE